ncbi:flagellar basal body protein [Paucibacter sp. APW11]|uniref:Flagellar basal body protein n=1 Tax=Roseateles aquae TaxID=3077235 RepID=A0ABU3P8I7_9BURK|nr:flagellar basal body protein [Paucibacter sp. APW11]MDT8998886.1 flagellar basal body protein [Paucibacter sp. APW11]
MAISLSTALSGIAAANERIRASSNNIANVQTPGYRRERVELSSLPADGVQARAAQSGETGPALEADLVEQRSATYAFVANLKMLQTQVRAEGTLLDIKA